jgi:hypothetical protein
MLNGYQEYWPDSGVLKLKSQVSLVFLEGGACLGYRK